MDLLYVALVVFVLVYGRRRQDFRAQGGWRATPDEDEDYVYAIAL